MTKQNNLGHYRVGIEFNPSRSDDVTRLKDLAAQFINECEKHKREILSLLGVDMVTGTRTLMNIPHDTRIYLQEKQDLLDIAMRKAEDAAMWAVKAVTKRPPLEDDLEPRNKNEQKNTVELATKEEIAPYAIYDEGKKIDKNQNE